MGVGGREIRNPKSKIQNSYQEEGGWELKTKNSKLRTEPPGCLTITPHIGGNND
jgi:hypothetical protein